MVADMIQVTIREAKMHLSKLIQQALAGDEVIITRRGGPLVKLMALPAARPARRLGGAAGVVKTMADDFDAPLTDFQEYME